MRPLVRGFGILALAGAYYLAGRLGLALASINASASPVWPPTGIAIVGLVFFGFRAWPAILVVATAFNLQNTGHFESSLFIGIGNTGEALVGAFVIGKIRGTAGFQDLRGVSLFATGMMAAAAVSATVGISTLAAFDLAPTAALPSIGITWWLGDLAGAIVLVPLLLHWKQWRQIEFLTVALSLAAAILAFRSPWTVSIIAIAIALPIAASRPGRLNAQLAVFITGAVAVVATRDGHGPLVGQGLNDSLLLLQLFLIFASLAALILGAGRQEVGPEHGAAGAAGIAAGALSILPLVLGILLIGAVLHPTLSAVVAQHQEDDLQNLQQDWESTLDRDGHRLVGAAGLMATADNITRSEFTAYVEQSGWLDDPGILAIGYVQNVKSSEVDEYTATVKGDLDLPPGLRANFSIFPASNPPVHSVVTYLVPLAGNEGALGLDLRFNASREAALLKSIGSGQPTLTGPVVLVQADGGFGVLFVQPVFRNGQNIGFVDSVRLVETAAIEFGPASHYRIVDIQSGTVIYGNDGDALQSAVLAAGGQAWRIDLLTAHGLTATEEGAPWFVALTSGFVTLAVGSVSYAYSTTRRRAAMLGREMVEKSRDDIQRQQEAHELRRMDAFRRQFLNHAAHELGTPLTPMKLQLYVLQNRDLAPEDRKSVEILSRSSKRLEHIVKDLLDATRLDSGQLEIRPEETNVVELIALSLRAYADVAKKSKTTISHSGPERLNAWVDPNRISQVIDNLLSNALKFSPGGEIRLEIGQRKDEFQVSVTDSGIGFTEELAGELMKPFSQIHDASLVTEKGTGLGLYICKNIVALHGGTLTLHSDGPGLGATATLTLPLKAVQKGEGKEKAPSEAA